jgi:hypothetical protein
VPGIPKLTDDPFQFFPAQALWVHIGLHQGIQHDVPEGTVEEQRLEASLCRRIHAIAFHEKRLSESIIGGPTSFPVGQLIRKFAT